MCPQKNKFGNCFWLIANIILAIGLNIIVNIIVLLVYMPSYSTRTCQGCTLTFFPMSFGNGFSFPCDLFKGQFEEK